ncbi:MULTISPECIES: hypothetical protein [unclassified Bradyrhizobium]|uniref:hypothetical protein n=1 Tax=Bradyrhizobium TaxID=374 RepID=UPI0028E348FD|nr:MULTISPECIES: hypothetical protein [unclassified Bradyrhizobium]
MGRLKLGLAGGPPRIPHVRKNDASTKPMSSTSRVKAIVDAICENAADRPADSLIVMTESCVVSCMPLMCDELSSVALAV